MNAGDAIGDWEVYSIGGSGGAGAIHAGTYS